jgi:two-component system, response regulator PdtaR
MALNDRRLFDPYRPLHAAGPRGAGEARAMSKGKILVVDDDRLVLATVTHGLAKAGYEIIDADNGDDAILLARQHRPDLALLDIRMEGMSGFDVAAYLRESLQTPFMFLSAFADDATVAQVKALGAVAYLVKPLDISQIVPTVEAALVTARARKASALGPPAPAPHIAPENIRPDPFAPAPPPSSYTTPHEPSVSALTAPNDTPDPLADLVAIAVGVLMHRYSLPRREALERLNRMASADGLLLKAEAQRLLDAVELLARPGNA